MKILSELTYSMLDAVPVADYFVYPREGKYKVGLKVSVQHMIPLHGTYDCEETAVNAAKEYEKRTEFPQYTGKPLEMPTHVQMVQSTVVTCVYCGQEYPDGTPAAKAQILTDHIKVCTKHPMRVAEQRIKQLEQALSGLVDHYYVPSEAWDYAKKALDAKSNTCDRCTLAFKVWDSNDVWDYKDVQLLAGQLDMRQHYVKVGMPTIIKYKKMIDDEILMILDKVMRLPSDWHKDAAGPQDGMSKPYWKEGTENGSVKRICTIKSTFDIDTMRMPDNRAHFPSPEEVALVIYREICPIDSGLTSNCRPDSKGFYYLSNVECAIKVDAYMAEMYLYLYAVDFFGGDAHG